MRAVVVLLAVAVLVSGCGDLGPAELDRGVQSLTAIAAEGALLAEGAGKDDTKATFTRVHATALADDARHEAEKLSDAGTSADTGRYRDRAVEEAGSLADALEALATKPGDEEQSRGIAAFLSTVKTNLDDLSARIPE